MVTRACSDAESMAADCCVLALAGCASQPMSRLVSAPATPSIQIALPASSTVVRVRDVSPRARLDSDRARNVADAELSLGSASLDPWCDEMRREAKWSFTCCEDGDRNSEQTALQVPVSGVTPQTVAAAMSAASALLADRLAPELRCEWHPVLDSATAFAALNASATQRTSSAATFALAALPHTREHSCRSM